MSFMINNIIIDEFPIIFFIHMANLNTDIVQFWSDSLYLRFQVLAMTALFVNVWVTQSAANRTNQIDESCLTN